MGQVKSVADGEPLLNPASNWLVALGPGGTRHSLRGILQVAHRLGKQRLGSGHPVANTPVTRREDIGPAAARVFEDRHYGWGAVLTARWTVWRSRWSVVSRPISQVRLANLRPPSGPAKKARLPSKSVLLWDIGNVSMAAVFRGHSTLIYSIACACDARALLRVIVNPRPWQSPRRQHP